MSGGGGFHSGVGGGVESFRGGIAGGGGGPHIGVNMVLSKGVSFLNSKVRIF